MNNRSSTGGQGLAGKLIDAVFGGFMSVLLPGFGQLHNGQWNKAAWLFLLFCAATLAVNSLVTLFVPPEWFSYAFFAALAAAPLIWLYAVLDAMICGWKRSNHKLQRWQTFPVYTLAFLLGHGIWLGVVDGLIMQGIVREHLIDRFRIPSESMEPGLRRGDWFFADKRVNCPGCTHRVGAGDVVLFTTENRPDLVVVKRVIGMPGDTIVIDGINVLRNGKSLTKKSTNAKNGGIRVVERIRNKTYTAFWRDKRDKHQEYTVPQGHIFVMGDNRTRSRDSRFIGPVPLENVIAIPRQIFLSHTKDFDIRWKRVGKVVR